MSEKYRAFGRILAIIHIITCKKEPDLGNSFYLIFYISVVLEKQKDQPNEEIKDKKTKKKKSRKRKKK